MKREDEKRVRTIAAGCKSFHVDQSIKLIRRPSPVEGRFNWQTFLRDISFAKHPMSDEDYVWLQDKAREVYEKELTFYRDLHRGE